MGLEEEGEEEEVPVEQCRLREVDGEAVSMSLIASFRGARILPDRLLFLIIFFSLRFCNKSCDRITSADLDFLPNAGENSAKRTKKATGKPAFAKGLAAPVF